jgi:tetratricopeptide (TPR) repeat protein
MKKQPSIENRFVLKNHLGWIGGILVLTLVVYWKAFYNGFTNWDDEPYVTENFFIRELNWPTIKYWLTAFHHGNYHPITMLTYMLDYHFAKLNPLWYHVENVIFHLFNTFLVYLVIWKLFRHKTTAVFSAFVFALHPMHVESVAWISERKDVLFTFFYFLGLNAYLNYIETSEKKQLVWVYVFFLLSLLSKPAAITFCLVLPLIDYWKGRSFTKPLILEKIPFFIISFIFGIIAIKAQMAAEAIADAQVFTVWQRIMFASYAVLMYLYKFFVPVNQANFHPYPTLDAQGNIPFIFYVAPLLFLILTAGVLFFHKKSRTLVFGYLFFFFNLILVLQLVSVGNAIIAERYTYVPYVGLAAVLGEGLVFVEQNRKKWFKPVVFLTAVWGVFLIYRTYHQIDTWKDALSLWNNQLKVYPDDVFGHNKRGTYLAINKKYEEALKDFQWIAKYYPNNEKALLGIANIYGQLGQPQKALEYYNRILEINPNTFEARVNRAITYSMLKQYDKALEDYAIAAQIKPEDLKIYINRSYTYLETKQYAKAVEDYNRVLQVDKNNVQMYFYRGVVYLNNGNFQKAINDFSTVIQMNPQHKLAYYNRGIAYFKQGKNQKALQDLQTAEKLGQKVNPQLFKILQSKKE